MIKTFVGVSEVYAVERESNFFISLLNSFNRAWKVCVFFLITSSSGPCELILALSKSVKAEEGIE